MRRQRGKAPRGEPATHRASMTQKAVTGMLLSTGLGGLCIASLAPLANGSRAVSHGSAEGAKDAAQRQDVWSQDRQHRQER